MNIHVNEKGGLLRSVQTWPWPDRNDFSESLMKGGL